MDDLLPHYERELASVRALADDFARDHPDMAARLQRSADAGADPHVERLFQSFALLASRVRKRLDDDFSLFTESLLGVLYPHYLRPFPSCSIAQLKFASDALPVGDTMVMPRGTMLESKPVRGVKCKFRTAYEVALMPIRLGSVEFRCKVDAPDGSSVPRGASSRISLRFDRVGVESSWTSLPSAIRLFIDGDGSIVGALRDALCGSVVGMLLQSSATGAWESCGPDLPRWVGFSDDESLIDFDACAHAPYRLLTEYFTFPEKFNFVDIPVPNAMRLSAANSITLHLFMGGIGVGAKQARFLETVDEGNLLLGCTPISNQFKAIADRLQIVKPGERHPVLPVDGTAFAWEVLAIDRVYRILDTARGEAVVQEFHPLYSFRHAGIDHADAPGCYWHAVRDEFVDSARPGRETQIMMVDSRSDPVDVALDALTVEVRATNRDLPRQLSIGDDLMREGGDLSCQLGLLRQPSRTYRFKREQEALWRVISQLSLNHLSLSGTGVEALRGILRLYNLPDSFASRRQIEGIVAIDHAIKMTWMRDGPMASLDRGMKISLTVDDEAFAEVGLGLFVQVMDRFFALYAHVNSFTQLRLVSANSQEELVTCPPRRGEIALL